MLIRSIRDQLRNRTHDGGLIALDQHALRGVAEVAIRMGQEGHDLRRFLGQLHGLQLAGLLVRHDAPDVASVDRLLQLAGLDVGLQVVRQEGFVLHNPARHVHNVKGTFRTIAHVHRAEARTLGRA